MYADGDVYMRMHSERLEGERSFNRTLVSKRAWHKHVFVDVCKRDGIEEEEEEKIVREVNSF